MEQVGGVRGNPSPTALDAWTQSHLVEKKVLFGNGKDSSQLVLSDLLEIFRAVDEALQSGAVPVITHGTDTLGITGGGLAQLFPDCGMVITGSFHPPNVPNTDATNFTDALDLAEALAQNSHFPKVPYGVLNG